MRYIYEVKEYMYDYAENQTLYENYLDAESDFNFRVRKFSNSLRLVTDKDVIKENGYTEGIVIMDRHDTNPNNLKQALILHYPVQFEVEGEPLRSDIMQIDIVRRELR